MVRIQIKFVCLMYDFYRLAVDFWSPYTQVSRKSEGFALGRPDVRGIYFVFKVNIWASVVVKDKFRIGGRRGISKAYCY